MDTVLKSPDSRKRSESNSAKMVGREAMQPCAVEHLGLTRPAGFPRTSASKWTTSKQTGLTISHSTTFTAGSWGTLSRTGRGCTSRPSSRPFLFHVFTSSLLTVARNTSPGGWVEFIDLDLVWTSPDGSLLEEHAGKRFNNEFIKASHAAGIEPCPGLYLEKWMKDAGFKDVKAEKFVWPVGTWPKDKHLVSVVRPFLFMHFSRYALLESEN